MPMLSGLPGRKRDLRALNVASPTAALLALRSKLAASAAGSDGALNVWRDDVGMYRCEFMRFRRTVDSRVFHRLIEVRGWLKEWLPKVEDYRD